MGGTAVRMRNITATPLKMNILKSEGLVQMIFFLNTSHVQVSAVKFPGCKKSSMMIHKKQPEVFKLSQLLEVFRLQSPRMFVLEDAAAGLVWAPKIATLVHGDENLTIHEGRCGS